MKDSRCLALFAATFALTACDTMNRPISSGSFDPLVPPGANRGPAVIESTFRPGQFVDASLDNTSFFRTKPKGNANADKLLAARTPMKIVAVDGSYLKVELDNGEVGYVPSILVSDPNAVPSPNEFQVYPPLPGGPLDPTGNVPVIPLDPANPQAPAPETLPTVIEPGTTPAPDPGATKPEAAPAEGSAPAADEAAPEKPAEP
jgi:hypothetical protein